MKLRNMIGALAVSALAAGCTAPVVKGDSVENKKQLSFPKVGVQSKVNAGGLAVLHTDYQSKHIFQLTKPLNVQVMLVNRIVVPTDEQLIESDVDGETVYCSANNTYVDALTGPWAKTCFRSTVPGKFSSVMYRPGAIWLSKNLSPEADFTSREIQARGQSKPLKRELIFEGSHDGMLLFSERIYEQSLVTPARVKPLIASISSIPSKIDLDGMHINVINYQENVLTFEVVNPWN